MRSTMAPEMSAAVMIANVPWKHMKSRCGNRALLGQADAVQEEPRGVANPVVARSKRQRVAERRPEHAHESERDETHHHRVQRVLGADQPAVEERERRRHQQHQRSRYQHPCSVGLVHILTSEIQKQIRAAMARARSLLTIDSDRSSTIKIGATPTGSPRRSGDGVSRPKTAPSRSVGGRRDSANLHFCVPQNCVVHRCPKATPTSCPARRCGCCSRDPPAARTRDRPRFLRCARRR